jgi:hypothetical protein
MSPAKFEHTIPASALSQTHALDRAATEIGIILYLLRYINFKFYYCNYIYIEFFNT